MTTTADIPLPSGLRHIVNDLIVAVRIGLRRFWRGGEYANAPASESLTMIHRLSRILRWAFVILAVHLELAPHRPRAPRAGRTTRRTPLRRPVFPLFPRYRIVTAGAAPGPVPAGFARAGLRDRMLTVQRKLDALARALADPMPFVRRMARRLPTQLMVFGWRPPKRPPPTDRRDFWDELLEAFYEARHALSEFRRRTRAIGDATSGL
ncbi:MAG: hypothetical protein NW200_09790 [Hyphomonadaceae bacterium]|nr:hypothetical protein [Hyphomonadaceae bacterium]